MVAPKGQKHVRFEVVEATAEKDLGFDPAAFSKAGNATCPFCGTVADSEYVRDEGAEGRLGHELMAAVANASHGKTQYLASHEAGVIPDGDAIQRRIHATYPDVAVEMSKESIEANPRSMDVQHYGFHNWSDLHNSRQLLSLIALSATIQRARKELARCGHAHERATAILTFLADAFDRVANYCTVLCVWRNSRTCVLPTFSRQALPMVWDYGEMNPFAGSAGDWSESIEHVSAVAKTLEEIPSRVRDSRFRDGWPVR